MLFRPATAENLSAPLTYETTIHLFSVALNVQLERVFGRRSPGFAGRLLSRSPEPPVEDSAPASESAPQPTPAAG